MALYDNSSSDIVMPVTPMGTANNNGGFGWGGDGSFWIIILFLFAMFNGGWGGNGWGNNANNGMFPYMMTNTTNNDVQRGFDQSAVMNGINGISNSLANAEVSRCNGIGNIINSVNNGFNGIQTSLTNNQMGLYQALSNNHSDTLQAMNAINMSQIQNANALAMNLQQCLDDNTIGTCAA